jgi:hypothetical protein
MTDSPVKQKEAPASESQPALPINKLKKKKPSSDDDTDFQVDESDDDESEDEHAQEAQDEVQTLQEDGNDHRGSSKLVNVSLPGQKPPGTS